ncbi:MAG: paraquat-inducible protein A [Gammaproteobacteria bacterium]|nr:paraquat-inducible protein A [Gammaproteobacteria bacterium]
MADALITAKNAGLIACRFCHTLTKVPPGNNPEAAPLVCPVCGSALHSRIPHSIEKTIALLLASVILYIPANTLPVMSMVYLGQNEASTIMSGVIDLAEEGLWPLAVIVFVASIFVPVMKLLTLTTLLLSVTFKSRWRPLDRTRIYRVTELVGRWSMVDIYVIALLVALVQFGNIATVHAGVGSLSFAAVVILTMFAAHTFDPRLIWDVMEHTHDRTE